MYFIGIKHLRSLFENPLDDHVLCVNKMTPISRMSLSGQSSSINGPWNTVSVSSQLARNGIPIIVQPSVQGEESVQRINSGCHCGPTDHE